MHISRFILRNYKSFIDSGVIELRPGFNVICGQNNAGKTALLEPLDSGTHSQPHRSIMTARTAKTVLAPNSTIDVTFEVSPDELREIMGEQQQQQYRIARPVNLGPEGPAEVITAFFERQHYSFQLRRVLGQNWQAQNLPSYDTGPVAANSFILFNRVNGGRTVNITQTSDAHNVDIGVQLGPAFQDRLYKFSAERFNVGVCPIGSNPRLAANASNLPEVLNVLQSNTPQFEYFNELVREVIPQVQYVSVSTIGSNHFEIRVWTAGAWRERRLDLAMSLAQSGTGIGQVLAILYVALFATGSQVIVIDEPQNFLHPGAIRKLIHVLKQRSEHQYIVATHSPTVLSAASASTIFMCRISDGISQVTAVDPNDGGMLRSYLMEVGARLSDVFGADNILWVEGRTEEICFPMILERAADRRLRGTVILAVSNTGDLQRRDAERIFDMYQRLSQKNSLLPPALGFVFDAECRTASEKSDLTRRSRDLLRFLPRRMYENYLLHPAAIAAVANQIEGFVETPVAESDVAERLARMENANEFSCPQAAEIARRPWIESTDAASVLGRLFTELSETRVSFDKTTHSIKLTEWLLANEPGALRDISDILVQILGPESS